MKPSAKDNKALFSKGQPVYIATLGVRWSGEIFCVTQSWQDADCQWHYALLNLRTQHQVKDCAEHHLFAFKAVKEPMRTRLSCIDGGLPDRLYSQKDAPRSWSVHRANGTAGGHDDAA